MNSLLQEIFDSNTVIDEQGNKIQLDAAVHIDEANFISRIIIEHRLSKVVEVGCAMGISALAIEDAMKGMSGTAHYIIDPNQGSQWKNLGVHNLKKAGFSNFMLIEDYSEFALPRLAKEGVKVNLGFIDGWHTFDHTLLDFFYINRMLEVNGVVIIDDVHMDGINRVARYIYNYPAYRYLGKVERGVTTLKRKMFEGVGKALGSVKHLLGTRVANEFLNGKLLQSDKKLHLDGTMIAFQKIDEDKREWNWHKNF
ncbi:MAG TPA: class I SAM-dependent methyltransferase [Puia sp.]|jgi:predicted O-methyltransferase YrrM